MLQHMKYFLNDRIPRVDDLGLYAFQYLEENTTTAKPDSSCGSRFTAESLFSAFIYSV